LDRLTDRLVEDLERRGDPGAAGHLPPAMLERRLAGRLDPTERARVEAHLNECLTCLNAFVELRDHLLGVADPGPVAPRLQLILDELAGRAPLQPRRTRMAGQLRRLVTARFPAWAVAGAAAAVLLTWGVAHYRSIERTPATMTPAHSQTTRTVSGVVSSVRDATSNGVDAYVVSVHDASGATYVLFAWGRPSVHDGERVEIDAVFAKASESAGRPVYQGVATALRPGK
jgi:predicted anti-sigma-YlaC factor YlaD